LRTSKKNDQHFYSILPVQKRHVETLLPFAWKFKNLSGSEQKLPVMARAAAG
jgi:hypothetical protein